ncbi:GNAT family N-acetyltransferase [Flammeovirgaceae bacterium SG7u.111]|nr:GNAT family N-acetyltransferase [Flammeovirgaceae bacterium SG7u.132]WPO34260.1 GNAT family N-acetyltransferase [Flammeovirgaceae bacterium SG7u.111]
MIEPKKEGKIKEITAEQTWPLRQEVMWPNKPLDYVKVEGDDSAKHFGLFVENELVSVVSLFEKGEKLQFRKFATKVTFQGKGYGSQLLHYLIEQAKGKSEAVLFCNARKEKTAFYEKFGLACTSQTFQKGGIDYVIMERSIG